MSPSPRVAMVVPALPRGGNVTGSPAHVRKLVKALDAAGAQVSLHELRLDGPAGLARAATGAMRLAWRVRAERSQLVYCHGHIAALIALPAARLAGIPAVCEVHGLYVASGLGQPGSRPFLSRLAKASECIALRSVDLVVAQARSMARHIEEGARVPRERLTILYPGLETSEFSGYRGPPAVVPNLAPGQRAVMYVGSIHGYQGLDLLAAAQRHLPPGHRVVLLLSSDGGPTVDPIVAFGFDAATTSVVRPSSPSELPAWLAAADVLVHARPDVPDNLNVQSKLGLYLASGRPIAATNVGDYEDLLGEAAGCVLSPPDPLRLAAAIARAANDPRVSEAAAEHNPVIARRHFEVSDNAKRLLARCAALGIQ